jgi:hypothetical protein
MNRMTHTDPEIHAVQQVHAALKDLDTETRARVLQAALALLGTDAAGLGSRLTSISQAERIVAESAKPQSARPLSLVEFVQDKNPGTNAQRIALFAYYRERYEGVSRFGREDLKNYFQKARLPPPGNYDRDFVTAVQAGWLHEDGNQSYITSRGLEAVESGFVGERSYTRKARGKGSSKKKGAANKRAKKTRKAE